MAEFEVIQGKDGEWVPVTGYLGCCDCGLIHQMEYKLVDNYGEPVDLTSLLRDRGVKLMVRSFRDREMTKKARESKNFVCKIGGGKNEG